MVRCAGSRDRGVPKQTNVEQRYPKKCLKLFHILTFMIHPKILCQWCALPDYVYLSFFMQLLEHPNVGDLFPSDVIARARSLLSAIPGGVGAYRCEHHASNRYSVLRGSWASLQGICCQMMWPCMRRWTQHVCTCPMAFYAAISHIVALSCTLNVGTCFSLSGNHGMLPILCASGVCTALHCTTQQCVNVVTSTAPHSPTQHSSAYINTICACIHGLDVR